MAQTTEDTHGDTVRVLVLAVASLACASCLQIGTGDAADAAAPPPVVSGASDASGAEMQGSGCVVDSVSGLTLCTSVAACAGVAVDHDAYPNCGFRASSGSLEIDCVCGDFICPLGAAIRCDQVQQLLAGQSEGLVCTQVSEGRCAARSPSATGGGGSCDRNCLGTCAGDPGCALLCGC